MYVYTSVPKTMGVQTRRDLKMMVLSCDSTMTVLSCDSTMTDLKNEKTMTGQKK